MARTDATRAKAFSGQTIYVTAVFAACALLLGYVFLFRDEGTPLEAQIGRTGRSLSQIPFDGAAALNNLKQLCDLGPRTSGSAGMQRQQTLLAEHFEKLGAKVERQEFQIAHPIDGTPVMLANLIAHWHPDKKERLLLAAHYDTRPYPDRDPLNPRGRFVGANDGASGVALLMEMGRHMPQLAGRYGVDFVLFDGEELVFRDQPPPSDPYFLGSKHFAQQYIAKPPGHRYRLGVLLDMVGDENLALLAEPTSMKYAGTTVRDIWATARRLGVREFINQTMATAVNDDHVPLNEIARIPTCDLIDFDYPYWHTQDDLPAHCSALSLARVGWVVHEWLKVAVGKPVGGKE
jgi:hypothetical protein